MVDRDFIAVEYAQKNCELNQISNYDVRLSNGFSHLEGLKFDLIISNLPSHFSKDMLEWILHDSKNHLNDGGKLYVVTVSKLVKFIKRESEGIFGNYEKVDHNSMYTISLAKKQCCQVQLLKMNFSLLHIEKSRRFRAPNLIRTHIVF